MIILFECAESQLFGVAPEEPSHSRLYLGQANISAANHYTADLTPVTIDLAALSDGLTVAG